MAVDMNIMMIHTPTGCTCSTVIILTHTGTIRGIMVRDMDMGSDMVMVIHIRVSASVLVILILVLVCVSVIRIMDMDGIRSGILTTTEVMVTGAILITVMASMDLTVIHQRSMAEEKGRAIFPQGIIPRWEYQEAEEITVRHPDQIAAPADDQIAVISYRQLQNQDVELLSVQPLPAALTRMEQDQLPPLPEHKAVQQGLSTGAQTEHILQAIAAQG